MKKNNYLLAMCVLASIILLFGCSKVSSKDTNESIEEYVEQSNQSDIAKILYLFEQYDISSAEEGSDFMNKVCGDVMLSTKGTNNGYENLSPEAATIISNFQNLTVYEDETEQSVKDRFYAILNDGGLDPESDEYTKLQYSIEISFELMDYLAENQVETKASKFWSTVGAIARCVGGTVGSAGLGALAGAGVGTVTLPIVGTVSGTAVGAVCGGLVGAATFC